MHSVLLATWHHSSLTGCSSAWVILQVPYRGSFQKTLSCLLPRMDCQYSSYCPLVQHPGHSAGNLCRYAKCRLNSHMSWHPHPVASYYVLRISSRIDGSPWVSYNYLETAKGLNGCFTVSAWVVLFYIRHFTCLNGVYFILEYRGVEPTDESMPPARAPSMHSITSPFIALGPFRVKGQAPFTIYFKPVQPFTLVKELDRDWLVCGMHISVQTCQSPFVGWVHAPIPEIV